MQFRDLAIGDEFDFIDPYHYGYNSFYLRCTKTSPRKYTDSNGTDHTVGSIKAKVYHVKERAQ